MVQDKSTLLVVEDDLDVADMLSSYFRVQGYEVICVNWGQDAIETCRARRPDLVILDIRLPDIDGYEVARRLRASRRTEDIPVIFLTENRQRGDRLQGLEIGADDYITKPFDIQELRLRVRNALRRNAPGSLTNPVTGLAEGALLEERLRECLNAQNWAMLVIELLNFDEFREAYGFVASDDVLRAIGLMVHNAVREIGGPSDFIGQLSPTRFLLVTAPDALPRLSDRIHNRLNQSLNFFYPASDREATASPGKHLAVRMGQLGAHEGPFRGLDGLKKELLRRVC